MLVFRPDKLKVSEKKEAKQKSQPTVFDGNWAALVQTLPLAGGAKELARNSELRNYANGIFELVVPKAMGHLAGESFRDKLRAVLAAHFGTPVKVQAITGETSGTTAAALESAEKGARRAEAVRAVQGDNFVQELVNLFDGRVVDSTIREKQR